MARAYASAARASAESSASRPSSSTSKRWLLFSASGETYDQMESTRGVRLREAPAVEAARVAEDHRPGRARHRQVLLGRRCRGHLLVGRLRLLLAPGPQVAVAVARLAALQVLERPRVLVHVGEVEEDLDDVLLLRVAVPPLGGNPLVLARVGLREPVVHVEQAGLEPAVGIDDAELGVRDPDPQPGAVWREGDARLLAHVAADDEVVLALRLVARATRAGRSAPRPERRDLGLLGRRRPSSSSPCSSRTSTVAIPSLRRESRICCWRSLSGGAWTLTTGMLPRRRSEDLAADARRRRGRARAAPRRSRRSSAPR